MVKKRGFTIDGAKEKIKNDSDKINVLKKLEKLINSELSSKVKSSIIENEELLIETEEAELLEAFHLEAVDFAQGNVMKHLKDDLSTLDTLLNQKAEEAEAAEEEEERRKRRRI